MGNSFGERLRHAWNAFNGNQQIQYRDIGSSYSYRPDRVRLSCRNERSIVTSVYNRIAMDIAAIKIRHVYTDDDGNFVSFINSGLDNCLSFEANIDESGRSFIQDVVLSMLDEGVVAIVPIDTDIDPDITKGYDVLSMRTGQIIDWYPRHVRVRVYDDRTGQKRDVLMAKSNVAIVENPLYSVVNEPNSTMQRLIRKLVLLDAIDEQSGSGKLDLIIQLPYVVKSDARKKQAEERRADIEQQLTGSKYGIAYTDGTEHITQLNRPVENNLMKQIEYLTSMLYSQLGINQSVLDGTADDKAMTNYYARTCEPIVSAIVDSLKRTFLSKTARTRKQSIMYFRDPFSLVPLSELSELADKLTRNEIMSSNEIRQKIGLKPSNDPDADKLKNKNISHPDDSGGDTNTNEEEENQNGEV